MARPFLTAAWRNLLMANYIIDPSLLQKHLPYKTELDTFNGNHYVSLVGFLFEDVRVLGLSIPYHTIFEEINLRFYVRYKEDNDWKRGVVFIKEIVPRRMITAVANTLYGENYITLPTKHEWLTTGDELHVKYEWKVGAEWNHISCIAANQPQSILPGSEEEFITEHYWGYTCINQQCAGEYEVAHPKWRIHAVKQYDIACSVKQLYGETFEETLRRQPASVFLVEGSAIQVMKGSKISYQ